MLTTTGIFATADANSSLSTNLQGLLGKTSWLGQLKAMALTIGLGVSEIVLIAYALEAMIGRRPSQEDQEPELDSSDHRERGEHMAET